jgi:hypothetical protein
MVSFSGMLAFCPPQNILSMSPSANGRSELLPPLPTIHSRRILQRIFTHRSLSKRPRAFEDSPNDPSPDNEQ